MREAKQFRFSERDQTEGSQCERPKRGYKEEEGACEGNGGRAETPRRECAQPNRSTLIFRLDPYLANNTFMLSTKFRN